MRRRPERTVALATALATALVTLLVAVPGAARAASPSIPGRPVPAEAGTRVLPGVAMTAMVGAVDGGPRALVRVVPRTTAQGLLAVEVWKVDAAGRWTSYAPAALRREGSPDEVAGHLGQVLDRDGMAAVRVGDPARLLAWHDRGRERVLVVTQALRSGARPPCCLTVWAVGTSGGTTRLDLVGGLRDVLRGADGGAWSVLDIDLDGDGIDELLVTDLPQDRPGWASLTYLRWSGTRFTLQDDRLPMEVAPATIPVPIGIGDTDGQPGDEAAVFTEPRQAGEAIARPTLVRIGLHAGRLVSETAPLEYLPASASPGSMPLPNGGRAVVVSDQGRGMRLFRWPFGRKLELLAVRPDGGVQLGSLGSGSRAVLVSRTQEQSRPALGLFGSSLDQVGRLAGSSSALAFAADAVRPYVGPFPGGLPDGRAAFLFNGRLFTTPLGLTSAARVDETTAALLPATTPLGVLGPAGAWSALAGSAAFDAPRDGGWLGGPDGEPQPTSVTPTAEMMTREAADGVFQPTLEGAAPRPDAGRLLTGPSGFTAVVEALEGSRVLEFTGPPGSGAPPGLGAPGVDATLQTVTVGADPVRLAIEPPPAAVNGPGFDATVLVVTPGGHGYAARWSVTVVRGPAELSAAVVSGPISGEVVIDGQVAPGTQLTVDGRPVGVSATGRFGTAVSAPPWPTDVRLEAVDSFGYRSVRVLSVVGWVDYRRLPWVPIVGFLTVVAAATLYLRAPRLRPRDRRLADDDARLEEIE